MEDLVLKLVKSKLGINIGEEEMVRAHRTGQNTRNGSHLIIVKFTKYGKRAEVFYDEAKLTGSMINITEYLTRMNSAVFRETKKNLSQETTGQGMEGFTPEGPFRPPGLRGKAVICVKFIADIK